MPVDLDVDVVGDIAANHDLTREQAEGVIADSAPLIDFLMGYHDDDRFGSVWVTYDDGYQVHVRLADDAKMTEEIAALAERLSVEPIVHHGGGSAAELADSMEVLADSGVPFDFDTRKGHITVLQPVEGQLEMPELASDDVTISSERVVPIVGGEDASRSGNDTWAWISGSGWQLSCTAGFVWEGSEGVGYATAGHCTTPDAANYRYIAGGYSRPNNPGIAKRCGNNGDHQFIAMYSTDTVANTFDNKASGGYTAFKLAGGYYEGQPTLKIGRSDNGSTGTNTGEVVDYDSETFTGGGCPGTRMQLEYDNDADGGDSGGPVFLSYGGEWYLGALHSRSPGSQSFGDARWDISLPSGVTRICSTTTSC
jgi:hypothetical protein